ncbi:hypothetical protein FACS189487_07310 [Campylobacterota bacterium]|nr:hypothetical protein FACS189487_07310 [Campylobacterota bacterium]
MKTTFKTVLLIALISFFTGCGGGGGGSSEPTPPPDPDTVDFGAGAVIITRNIGSPSDFTDAKTEIEGATGNFVLNITGDVDIEDTTYIEPHADTNISLRGGGTLYLSTGKDGLFWLAQSESKLILRDTTLKGNTGNQYELVGVDSDSASFIMYGGTITGNTASYVGSGGGVSVYTGSFTMSGGTISGNIAISYGGGVYVRSGTFTMSGGTISDNSASTSGGGVYVDDDEGGTFTKTGGTIYGSNANPASLKNSAGGDTQGHAVFVGGSGAAINSATPPLERV